jgi:chitodextrinase
VVLRWTAPTASSALTELDVRVSTIPITTLNFSSRDRVTWLTDPGIPGTIQVAKVIDLSPNTRYYFALKVKESTGSWSTASSVVQLRTLAVSAYSGAGITLAWDPSPDLSVVGYIIYYGVVGSIVTNSTVVGNATITTIGNLLPNTTYFFFVTAYNAQLVESDPSNVITDTPLPSNSPPTLTPITSKTVSVGQTLTFRIYADDADIAQQSLAFTLDVGAPSGAGINPVTGDFSWTPSLGQGGANYSITVRVTDNGTPALSDAVTFIVTVP